MIFIGPAAPALQRLIDGGEGGPIQDKFDLADFVCVDGEQLDAPHGTSSRIGDEVIHHAGTVLRGESLPDLVADQRREKALGRRGPPCLVERVVPAKVVRRSSPSRFSRASISWEPTAWM